MPSTYSTAQFDGSITVHVYYMTCTQCAAVTRTTGLQLRRAAPQPLQRLSDL